MAIFLAHHIAISYRKHDCESEEQDTLNLYFAGCPGLLQR